MIDPKPITVTVELPGPDEVYTNSYGDPVARWGSAPCRPYDEEPDPVPSIYSSPWRIEVGDYPLDLEHAETYAVRILAAVHHERQALQRQADADLNAAARGNGATHDWDTSHPGMARCRNCRTRACDGEIKRGAVPVCSPDERCRRQPWHEIGVQLGASLFEAAGECIFCGTVYPATAQLEGDRHD